MFFPVLASTLTPPRPRMLANLRLSRSAGLRPYALRERRKFDFCEKQTPPKKPGREGNLAAKTKETPPLGIEFHFALLRRLVAA